jgi:predicted dehydrogenase
MPPTDRPTPAGPGRRLNRLSRRQFLHRSALGAAAATLAAPAIVRGENLNSRLKVAIIGSGGRGRRNLDAVAAEKVDITALCDVYEPALVQAGQQYPEAERFRDFRRLYDRAAAFDAVIVSTCEHTHAFATLPALQLGKHVYCEKPLTHGIWEARVIREAAARADVVTQMGIQNHSADNYRRVVELIRGGAIGPVHEAHVWVSRAWGWQSPEDAVQNKDIVSVEQRPADTSPVPAGLDWELWLGPAPYRPFHDVYFPGPKWYRWWDFGSGTMSDLGSHWNDLPFWALDLRAPLTIEASGPPPHAEIAPASMQATYEYGARGDLPPVRLTWYQGTNKPEPWQRGEIPQWPNGVLFIGSRGMLLADYRQYTLLPEAEFADFVGPEPSLPRSPGHQAEWVRACLGGPPALADFEYSGWLTEANHLGNVAYRLGRKITWDAEGLRAVDCPEADPLIRREYREGWNLG